MPYLCARFDSKQGCRNTCMNFYKTKIIGPEFDPSGSSRGMSKIYQLATGRKDN